MKKLPPPGEGQVKIWLQGSTGSGKTMLFDFIRDAIEKAGGKTARGWDRVPMQNQIVDLTSQNIDDQLVVMLGAWDELEKLQLPLAQKP